MPGFDAGGFTTWQALPEVLPLWTLMLRAPPHNVPWLAAMKPDPQDIGRWLRGCGWKETKSKWVECRQRSSSLNYLYMYNMYIILYILCVYVTHIYTRCSLPLKDTHPYLKLPWKKEAHYMFIWLGRASFESSPLFGPFHLPRRTPGHQLVEKGIADPFLRSQFLQPPKAQKNAFWRWNMGLVEPVGILCIYSLHSIQSLHSLQDALYLHLWIFGHQTAWDHGAQQRPSRYCQDTVSFKTLPRGHSAVILEAVAVVDWHPFSLKEWLNGCWTPLEVSGRSPSFWPWHEVRPDPHCPYDLSCCNGKVSNAVRNFRKLTINHLLICTEKRYQYWPKPPEGRPKNDRKTKKRSSESNTVMPAKHSTEIVISHPNLW